MQGLNLASLVGFFDLMHDAVVLIDRKHHIALYNRGAEELFGYPIKDVLGQDLAMLLPPSARKAHPAYVLKFAASPDDRRMMGERAEIKGLRQDGTVFPAEASLSKVSLGEETWFLAVIRDMSLQQEINRQALESAREKAKFIATLNTALSALPAKIAILDCEGHILFVSEKWAGPEGNIFAAPQIGANMIDYLEGASTHTGKYAELAAGVCAVLYGKRQSFEQESSFPDGTRLNHFYTTVTPLPKPEGGAVVMTLDITPRVERDNEIRVKGAALGATLTPIAIRALDGSLTFANKAFLDLWRIKDLAEAAAKAPIEFWEEGQKFDRILEDLIQTGHLSGHRISKPFDGSPGRHVFKSMSLIRNSDGAPSCYVSSYLDLTDRLRAEAAVRRSTDQMVLITDTLPFMVAYVDENLNLTFTNKKFEQAFGISRKGGLGQNISAVMPKEVFAYCIPHIEASLKGRKSEYEETLEIQPGQPCCLRSIFLPHIENDKTVGVFVIIEDISNQRQADAELRQSQKMQSIGTLAGGIAHDINNLLVPIMGLTEMVRDELTNEDNIRNLEDVLKASERARQLVGQILAFSRKDAPIRKRILLAPIVEETTDLLRSTLSRSITVKLDIQDTPPVDADEIQIQQIVMNLCSNAAHSLGVKGGDLSVSLTTGHPGPVFFKKHRGLTQGQYVKFSVRDTGCGMGEHTLSRIFEPFFTTKEVGEGTGMGLSVVHGIVTVHQGAIEVESELGKGSLFEVYLPAAQV